MGKVSMKDKDPVLAYEVRKLRKPKTTCQSENDAKDPRQFKEMKLDGYFQ